MNQGLQLPRDIFAAPLGQKDIRLEPQKGNKTKDLEEIPLKPVYMALAIPMESILSRLSTPRKSEKNFIIQILFFRKLYCNLCHTHPSRCGGNREAVYIPILCPEDRAPEPGGRSQD